MRGHSTSFIGNLASNTP